MDIQKTIMTLTAKANDLNATIDNAKKQLKEVEAKIKKANKLLAQANELIDGDTKD